MASANNQKRFIKQYVQLASPDEIIRSEHMDEYVYDQEAEKLIKVKAASKVYAPTWKTQEDVNNDAMSEIPENTLESVNGPPVEVVKTTAEKLKTLEKFHLIQMLHNNVRHESVIWFRPTCMSGKILKAPRRSMDLMTTVTFDLFANFVGDMDASVTIPGKTHKQIGTAHSLCTELENSLWVRTLLTPNWYGKIVATPEQDAQGILHGSSPYDPRQCDRVHSSREIVVSLFNFSEKPYVVKDQALIGRLVLNACHVPNCIDNPPNLLQLRFNGEC
jgi:hypothetical protein